MSWATVLENPEHLTAFFDGTEDLQAVSLFEIALDRDGPLLRLRGDLFRFADHRSPRWPAKANRVQIDLRLFPITQIEIRGWETTVVGDLEMQRLSPEEIEFQFHAVDVSIKGCCGFVRLDKVDAYCDDAI